MTDKVTIIISNYNSIHWLRIAVHQIRKHTKHPYHIIISEQTKDPYEVQAEYNGWDNVTVVPIKASSSGYGTDYILKNIPIDSEYICSMDVDTFPVSDEWLSLPIDLLNSFDLTWVGLRAEIESAYKLHYFHMGECYRIGRTKDFKLLSESVGFAQVPNDKTGWFDNAVRAHSWEDANYKHKKLSLPVTARMGLTLTEGEYGRLIGNLAVHFCFAFTSTLHDKPVKNVGEDYLSWEHKIKSLPPDEVVAQIMGAMNYSNRLQPLQYWDGENHATPPVEINGYVKVAIKHRGTPAITINEIGKYKEVRGVIHVGACQGRDYLDYTESGVDNIIMFEENTKVFNTLLSQAPDNVKCYRIQLTDKNGTLNGVINQAMLDDISFDRQKFNMLFIDCYNLSTFIFAGALNTLKTIDVIYLQGEHKSIGFFLEMNGFEFKMAMNSNFLYIRK
jgi:hypothetical protein